MYTQRRTLEGRFDKRSTGLTHETLAKRQHSASTKTTNNFPTTLDTISTSTVIQVSVTITVFPATVVVSTTNTKSLLCHLYATSIRGNDQNARTTTTTKTSTKTTWTLAITSTSITSSIQS